MILLPEDLLKIVLAIIAGGAIGLEREFRDKPAGFRTLIFICLGATLFTIFSRYLGGEGDATRIAANIVSGVGFLGAGVILRDNGKVVGLTTAATIWLTAGLGMGIGGGQYLLTFSATAIILVVLWIFPRLERRIDHAREEHSYEIVAGADVKTLDDLETVFEQSGLQVYSHQKIKTDEKITCTWVTIGSRQAHQQLTAKLIHDPRILELHY